MPGFMRWRAKYPDDILIELVRGHGLGRVRARPDKAQFATQHIDELGEFVDRCAADEAADFRDARIIFRHLLSRMVISHLVIHRPEFIDIDQVVVEPEPLLLEENRPLRFQPDCQRYNRQKRREGHKGDGRNDAIEHCLDRRIPVRKRAVENSKERHVPDIGIGALRELQLRGVSRDAHIQRQFPELAQEMQDALFRCRWQRNDEQIDRIFTRIFLEFLERADFLVTTDLLRRTLAAPIVKQPENGDRTLAGLFQPCDQVFAGLATPTITARRASSPRFSAAITARLVSNRKRVSRTTE